VTIPASGAKRALGIAFGVATVAFAGGLLVGRLSDRAPAEAHVAGPISPHPAVTFVPEGGSAEQVLARPLRSRDRPAMAVPASGLQAGAFRVLTAIDGSGVLLYATRDRSGGPCLAAVADDGRLTASCLPRAAFALRPIMLDLTVPRPPDRRGRTDNRVEIVAEWRASGQVTWRYVSG
jgi:hypothetical protein